MTTTLISLALGGVVMERIEPDSQTDHSVWKLWVGNREDLIGDIIWEHDAQQYVLWPRRERNLTVDALRSILKFVEIVNKEYREKWWETGISGIPTK